MSFWGNKKKKLLNFTLGILGASVIVSPLNYLFEKTNNFVDLNMNSAKSNSVKSNNDEVKLSYDNSNSDHESPNGVVNVVGTELIFTSWFNHELWRYDLKGSNQKNTILRQFFGPTDIETLKNINVKYNPYNDAFLIYGIVTKDTTKLFSFIIQVDANTGQEIIINNNANTSLWASEHLGELGHVIINEENGSLTLLPKFSRFSSLNNTKVARCDSSTYTPIWLNFTNLTSSGFTYNTNNDIPETFYVDENTWGFTYFIKGSDSVADKYQYFLFDNNFSFVAKSNEESIGTGTIGGNSSNIITKPLFFSYVDSGVKKYKIIDIAITPIYTEENFNDKFIDGSDSIKVHTFVPANGSTPASITKETTSVSLSNYAAYQLKKDNKNNIFYLSSFEKNSSKINFSKNKIRGFQVNNKTGAITDSSSESVDTYTGQKVVTNISIINDKFNKNTKTSLIKEVKNYGKINSLITQSTGINSLIQTRFLLTPSSTTTINNGVSWTKLTKDNYINNVTDSIKQKLASDVLENDISNLVKYKNGTQVASYVTNQLEEMTLEDGYQLTGTKKILYNNTDGKIKANVKSNIKKWWYEENDTSINSSLIQNTNIEITGFYTINDLTFKLVTSSSVNETKWNKIQTNYINKVLPSSLNAKDILDNFIVKGEKIILTDNDVNITNIDNNSSNKKNTTKKAIEVFTSDKSGTLEIKYDLKSKSSVSMEQTNVVGSYSYVGFLNTALNVPIKFNQTKFNELKKTKLANQFSKIDLLNVLEASNLYDTKDPKKWELIYTYDKNSEEYKKGLLQGKTNFTFKYIKPKDFPSNVQESDYTINISSTLTKNSNNKNTAIDGNNCLTLSDYIVDSKLKSIATFDQDSANLLTGTKSLDELKNNIDLFLVQTLTITNGIFKTNQIIANFDESSFVNKKATFNLSFKDENIISEINVVSKDGLSEEKLIIDKSIRNEIEKTNPSYFSLPKITFNYSLADFKWNYDFVSSNNNLLELSFDEMVNKVNEDRVNANKNPFDINTRLLPSDFVNYFTNKEKEFHNYFPLIKNYVPTNSLLLNTNNNNDPSYFEINKIQMIANDSNGTINIRYEIVYPNLSTINQVYKNPEVKLTGFKSKSSSIALAVAMITILSIIALIFVISVPLLLNMKRHRYLSSNLGKKHKKNKLKIKYTKKVINK